MISKPLLYFLLAAVLILVGRVPIIIAPPWDIDEGVYATVGQALSRGELLYRDIWDNKPPAIYFLFDWVSKVDPDYTSFRLAATVSLILAAAVIYYLARKVVPRPGIALATFAVLSIVPIFETHISNAEIFFLPLTSLAILLTVLIEWFGYPKRWYIATGALLALGFLFKPVVIFDGLAIVTLLLLKHKLDLKRELGWLSLGVTAVLTIPTIYLLSHNLTNEFVRAAFLNNLGYVRLGNLATLSFIDINNPWITLTGKVVALAAVLWSIGRGFKSVTPLTLIYIWLAWTIFGALLSGRPFLHYLVASIGALALLVPVFWQRISTDRQIVGFKSLKVVALAAALVLALVLGFGGKVQVALSTPEISRVMGGFYGNAYRYLSGQIGQAEYFDFYGEVVTANLKLSEYLKDHTSVSARVFIWGNAPWVYYLSGRTHATKYLVAYQTTFVKEAKREILAELEKGLPDIIIVTNEPDYLSGAGVPTPSFPELDSIIASNYLHQARLASADIYGRKFIARARTP